MEIPGPAEPPAAPPPASPPRPPARPDSVDEIAAVRAMAEERTAAPTPERESAEGGSLFKRMSAALQRAMGQPPRDEPPQP
jgi:hypothetical protein